LAAKLTFLDNVSVGVYGTGEEKGRGVGEVII